VPFAGIVPEDINLRHCSFQGGRELMRQFLALTSVLVRDYDEAIDFFIGVLGFDLIEDTPTFESLAPERSKRWVVVAPPGSSEGRLLLARATGRDQISRIGDQTGGRVFLFLYTDDFWRDYGLYKSRGVEFVRGEPREESYGTVAVFRDVSATCGI
jgi:catechol 2,3-dioxygenase-like lactoylglutathione lyase family enzyme